MYTKEEKDKMAMKNSTIDKFSDRYGVNDISPKQEQRIGRIAENNKDRAARVAGRIVDRNTRVERGAAMGSMSKDDINNTRTTAQNRRIGRIDESDKSYEMKYGKTRAERVMNRIDDRNYQKLNKQTFAEKKEAKMKKRQDVGAAIVKKKEDKLDSKAKTQRYSRNFRAGKEIEVED